MARLTILGAGAPAPLHATVVDVAHSNETARRRFGRRTAFDVGSLAWGPDDWRVAGGPSFTLEEHVGWLAPDAPTADPSDVVKQVSFLQKSDAVDLAGFRREYRHHVEVARRHMHTLWQYVQYDVVGVDGDHEERAVDFVAVSVLWFRTTDDFLHRYFASPEDQVAFTAQEGFLDLSKAFSVIVTSHPSAGPADRPVSR